MSTTRRQQNEVGGCKLEPVLRKRLVSALASTKM
jgi:hypothetical protein